MHGIAVVSYIALVGRVGSFLVLKLNLFHVIGICTSNNIFKIFANISAKSEIYAKIRKQI